MFYKQDLLFKSMNDLGTDPQTYFACDFILSDPKSQSPLAKESGHATIPLHIAGQLPFPAFQLLG